MTTTVAPLPTDWRTTYAEARRLEASADPADQAKAAELWATMEAEDQARAVPASATTLAELPIFGWAWRGDASTVERAR